jgi:hypothetical protein
MRFVSTSFTEIDKKTKLILGNVKVLEGGLMENAGLLLSGGIHSSYIIGKVIRATEKSLTKDCVISVGDLFFLMQRALVQNNIVGVSTETVWLYLLLLKWLLV